jgi:hypothetical protein
MGAGSRAQGWAGVIVTFFRRMGRRDLPPLKPLQRGPQPVVTTSVTVDAGESVSRLAALAEVLDAAAARLQAAVAEMPPRPQSPHHRMPPEIAEQRQSGDIYGGHPFRPYDDKGDLGEDPCGRPGPKITIAARETP